MYEIKLEIRDKDYVDSLIIALVRQGYDVYLSYDNDAVCFGTTDDEVSKIGEKK